MKTKDVSEKVRNRIDNIMDYDRLIILPDRDMTIVNVKSGEYEYEVVIVKNTKPEVDESIVYNPEGSTSSVTDISIDEAVEHITE